MSAIVLRLRLGVLSCLRGMRAFLVREVRFMNQLDWGTGSPESDG